MGFQKLGNSKKRKFLQQHEAENQDANKGAFDLYPKFSFEFNVTNDRTLEGMPSEIQTLLVSKLLTLSKQTWKDISMLPKAQGFEKMEKSKFKTLPNDPHKFKDLKHVDIFRLPSKKGRLIGYPRFTDHATAKP